MEGKWATLRTGAECCLDRHSIPNRAVEEHGDSVAHRIEVESCEMSQGREYTHLAVE